MRLDEAKAAVLAGSRFGDVYQSFVGTAAEHEELKGWFVYDLPPHHAPHEGATGPLPDGTATPAPAPPHSVSVRAPHRNGSGKAKAAAEVYGNQCNKCDGFMVRTGTCETCSACGESSGGCG